MKHFDGLTIAKKIGLLVGLVMACMAMGGLLLLAQQKSAIESEKRLATKHVVETAQGVVAHFAALEQADKLRTQAAQAGAIARCARCATTARSISGSTTCTRGWSCTRPSPNWTGKT